MKNLLGIIAVSAAFAVLSTAPAWATQETFERDLSVSGRVDLMVTTGAGTIHLTSGSAGKIHIVGQVRSTWGGNDAKVHEIADHPPIAQTGNIVRIGEKHQNFNNISIDYEIQAPPDSFLSAATGSGTVIDDGVGANAKLSTGSGAIHATGLRGGFSVETGSGNIDAEQVGEGDVRAETGSGSIGLKNLRGGLNAHTGSGTIKVSGMPTTQWKLETGSGNVEVWTDNAALTLNAESGSGGIHSDREITTQGTSDRHHMMGKIGGGGPLVKIETGSGSIRIH